MELVEVDNSVAGKIRDSILESLAHLRKDPLPVDFPVNLERYRSRIANAHFNGVPLPKDLPTDVEIEALRVEKHKNSARLQLRVMWSDPQPENSEIHQGRRKQFYEDMRLGGFTENDLIPQRRSSDSSNPNKGVDIQLKLLNGLRGTPQYEIASKNAKAKKAKAIAIVEQLRKLHGDGALFSDNHKMLMALLREALLGGFSKEQLGGGSFYSLDEVFTSREELDSFNPNKKSA